MAKPQIVSFISKFTELELVRQPSNDVPVPSGIGWIRQTNGVKYKFQPTLAEDGSGLVGRCDVPVGSDKLVDTSGWLVAGAEQGVERDAPTALRAHREFGRDFKLLSVPIAMIRAQIRKASVDLDEDSLVGLLERERSENNRAEVITEGQDALDLVREAKASLQAQAAAAEAEPTPKAKAKPKAAVPA